MNPFSFCIIFGYRANGYHMAPLRRRTVLGLAGASAIAGTAGCLGTLPGQSEDNDGDPPDEPESGTNEGDNDDTEPELDIPDCPEKPDSLTDTSVADYATQFEEARQAQMALQNPPDPVKRISVSTHEVNTTETDEGWEVHFGRQGPNVDYGDYHTDGPIQRVAYYVTEDTTLRTAAVEEPLKPQEDGESVECPPY